MFLTKIVGAVKWERMLTKIILGDHGIFSSNPRQPVISRVPGPAQLDIVYRLKARS